MKYEITEEIGHQAKHPHEVFLINLIFNHILLFVAFLSASALQIFTIIVPILSFILLTYILWRARRSVVRDPWFVMCHWQLAARRSRIFIIMLAIMAGAVLVLLLISGGDLKPQHYAFGGISIMPTMITVLALIIMESDALHQARNGILPKSMAEKYPNPEAKLVEE